MDVIQQINSMTNAEAIRCLNGVLEGFTATWPAFAELLSSTDAGDLTTVVCESATQVGATPPAAVLEAAIIDRDAAVKLVLQEMGQSAVFRPRIENWLATHRRAELFEPITTALVLAGIVAVLSTEVDVDYKNIGGIQTLHVVVKKKPSTEKLLGKFFGLFK